MDIGSRLSLLLWWLLGQSSGTSAAVEPHFTRDIDNVTVTLGKDATLKCSVENLNGYKVAWVRVDTQTILTIHRHVITRNYRIGLEHKERRQWDLTVSNVSGSDRGWYMCQINTDPMKFRRGYLEVVVPPHIDDKASSKDMVVREGDNVTLTCKATGYPIPKITWMKEDESPISINGTLRSTQEGQAINFPKISRLHMGAYLCIAKNGVPPAVSKRILLRVQFSPMLMIPNMLEAAYMGQNITIHCKTEAFPESINFWTNGSGGMINPGDKYEVRREVESLYKVDMSLSIRQLSKTDFTTYKCIAKNSLGSTEGTIKIYEISSPTTTSGTGVVLSTSDLGIFRESSKYNDGNKMRNTINDGYDQWKSQNHVQYADSSDRSSEGDSSGGSWKVQWSFPCVPLLFTILLSSLW